MNNPGELYEMYRPIGEWDNREYIFIIHKNGKQYGYIKNHNKQARYQHSPHVSGMKFVGYIQREEFEKIIFVDLL